jgi:hypothetical protein
MINVMPAKIAKATAEAFLENKVENEIQFAIKHNAEVGKRSVRINIGLAEHCNVKELKRQLVELGYTVSSSSEENYQTGWRDYTIFISW